MAVYHLVDNATATQTAPSATVPLATPSLSVSTDPINNVPAQSAAVQVVAVGPSASGSAQPIGSNDGVNWSAIGSAIATTNGVGGAVINAPYAFLSAYVTAISGTGAKVSVLASF